MQDTIERWKAGLLSDVECLVQLHVEHTRIQGQLLSILGSVGEVLSSMNENERKETAKLFLIHKN